MMRSFRRFKPRSDLFDVKAEATSPRRLGGGGRDQNGRAIPDAGSLGAQAPLSTGKSNAYEGGVERDDLHPCASARLGELKRFATQPSAGLSSLSLSPQRC